MKRKNQWLLFAILLLALINLSPSENSTLIRQNNPRENEPEVLPNQVTVQDRGHIKVAVQLPDNEFVRLQHMTKQFMEDHPVEVELMNMPANEDYHELMRQLELGESPDVLLLDNTWVRNFAVDGYLMPAENYYSGALAGEVLSASLAQNEWNGYVWGVPFDVDPYVWVYNRSRFNSVMGSEFPVTKNEWANLIEKYTQSSEPLPADFLAFDFTDPYASMSLIWQLGGQVKQNSSASPFEQNENIDYAVQQLDKLRSHLINLNEESETSGGIWDKLNQGEIAAALVRYTEVSKNYSSWMKIIFAGPDDVKETMWVSGRSYVVSARSGNKEAAGLWITEMTTQIKQRQWIEVTDHLPVFKNMYYQASRNGLPDDIPVSLINGKKSSIPVGAALPSQMKLFSELSNTFYNGGFSSNQFLSEIYNINEAKN
ncbi:arabinogalactan oligomer / maltooligosaccharide transport system substrate-binding protein [Fontibacillus panacisegetis]|uniref:Arabinogalactan oligomer / maltooligosaccharide transport system substrate-binding protein n=1 Tax=Fontibacillus panacisegetis TaxID=670482 RepID=A0A1G7FP89_9BACL|nr:extracellular solute-binding protein [Fontibacillus panacisegetis]SDE77649.1 arabinogalactan oligomer / maltooligosaccharide transport system substrate-binding protein [Fontibacillus panacisegetis]